VPRLTAPGKSPHLSARHSHGGVRQDAHHLMAFECDRGSHLHIRGGHVRLAGARHHGGQVWLPPRGRSAAVLLRQGFAVFRKLGRVSPCDLVMVKAPRGWRVAVRTVYSVSPRGRIVSRWPLDSDRFDVVASMWPEGGICDEPPLERLGDFEGGGPCGTRPTGQGTTEPKRRWPASHRGMHPT
jgi:hypothetical protein